MTSPSQDRAVEDAAPAPAPETAPPACLNCGKPTTGRYCSDCGEKILTHEDYSLKHFLSHTLAHELFHWEGKVGRTLKSLVIHPGEYAAHFSSGVRRPYVNPLRLYLVVFVILAFVTEIGSEPLTLSQRVERYDPTGWIGRLAHEHEFNHPHATHEDKRAESRAHWVGEFGTLVIVFLVSAVQMLVFRRFRRHYIEHLALGLTVITFSMLATIAGSLAALLIGRGHLTIGAEQLRDNGSALLLPFYWWFSIRRFYGASGGVSVLYASAITVAQVAIAFALNIAILALQVMTS